MPLSIQLFGPPQIYLDDQPVKMNRRKSRALLFYLADSPRPVTREQLLAFYWPDTPRPAAQQVLRTTLHGLRKAFGDSILAEEEWISLSQDVVVDARRFNECINRPNPEIEDLISASRLYQGDFLADFSLPDSQSFEEWVTVEREHYRREYIRVMASLSSLYAAQSDYAAALDSLETVLASEPLQEDLQREVIRLLYLSGDRPAAIRRYDQLRRLLDEEMGVPPLVETRALYNDILNDHLALTKPGVTRPASKRKETAHLSGSQKAMLPGAVLPFTGRDKELGLLSQALNAHKLALIEGEPGIGKTRLARELLRSSQGLMLQGTAYELENSLPYQPVIDALRGLRDHPRWTALHSDLHLPAVWMAEVSRLLPELLPSGLSQPSAIGRAVDLTADESRLWEGIHQFLLAVSRLEPIILFLDDLQWADASTLALLGYLVRQNPAPVSFLATSRPVLPRSPLSTLLQTLASIGRLDRVALTRLSIKEVEAIAGYLSPQSQAVLSTWLMKYSEGNPFVMAELVRHLRDQSILAPDGRLDTGALSSGPIVPPTVYSLIQARLARLSEPAHRVLDAAVAIGREFDFEVVAKTAGISENATLDALDELSAYGLITGLPPLKDGNREKICYSFDHNLTMEVAYREVGEARHRLMHRKAAEALTRIYQGRLDSVAGLIASHYAEGNSPEKAAPFAVQAGKSAARLAAWKEAAQFYEMALDQQTEVNQRIDILLALAEVQFRGGEVQQSTESYRAALALLAPDSKKADQVRLVLAMSLLSQARFADAIHLIQQARNMKDVEIARQVQFIWGTALSIEGDDLAGAADHLRQAEALCSQKDQAQLAEIKFELGSVAAQRGDLEQAIDLYRQSLAAAEGTEQGQGPMSQYARLMPRQILCYNNLAYHLSLLGDPTAEQYAQKGLQLAQEQGTLPVQTYLYSTLGEIRLAAGDLKAAEEFFHEGLALAEKLSMPERIAGLTANLGLVAKVQGNTELAIHRLSTALSLADTLGTRHLVAYIRLWLAPLLPLPEAAARIAEARSIAESGGRQKLLDEVVKLEIDTAKRQRSAGQ